MKTSKPITYLLFYTSLLLFFNSNIAQYDTEKPFVIVITSYNNRKWYEKNIQSVLSQKYTNFRVIYIDDFSPDGTGDLVEEYLTENDPDKKIHLIKNTIRRGGLHNLYTMAYMCDNDEIIVNLDGDDWFPDNEVLIRLNHIYSSQEVWLTYGQFQSYPSGAHGWASSMPDSIIEENAFRYHAGLPTHLRTYYAWLFKQIKLEDLLYLGRFYSMVPDMATMFPMIEMAGERHQFIPDIMYIYNQDNPMSEHNHNRQLQINLLQVLKKKKPYRRLTKKPIKKETYTTVQSDAIIFAQNPTNLLRLLKSLKMHVNGIDHIFVTYKPASYLETEDYATIQHIYPEIAFYPINDDISHFRDTLVEIYQKTKNNYILFAKDNSIFTKSVSLHECIKNIEEHAAYAFYFKLNAQEGLNTYQHLPLLECATNTYAWDFTVAENKWSSANSLDFVLYRKTDYFPSLLLQFYDLTLDTLEVIWTNELYASHIGLCFKESHVRIM